MDYEAPPPEIDPRLLEGLRLFDEGEYHRSHDVLEDLWLDEVGDVRAVLKALIQIAVGLYHRENGNLAGAARLLLRAADHVLPAVQVNALGIDVRDLESRARQMAKDIEAGCFDPNRTPRFDAVREAGRRRAREEGVPLELPENLREDEE